MKKHTCTTLYLVIFCIIALILRAYHITDKTLWVDELYVFNLANHSSLLTTISQTLTTDLHAPVFFVMVHYWIKLFGTQDSLLLVLPVMFSWLMIATGWFVCKKLFNTSAAVIYTLLATFNCLEIYYAKELKFYSLLPLLGLLSFYFFSKITEVDTTKTFCKKDALWLALINLLIIYTFNIGIIFVFIQFLTGLCFVLYKNKTAVKKFVISFLCTFVLYLPYFYFQINTLKSSKSGICTITDLFYFDFSFIQILFQNFFTPLLDNLGNNQINYNIFSNIQSLNIAGFLFFILIPLAISVFGIYKAIASKNTKNLLLIIWSSVSILAMCILAQLDIVPVLTRYVIIFHAILIMSVSYVLSLIKNKKALFVTICLIALPFITTLISPHSPALGRSSAHSDAAAVLKNAAHIKNTDFVLMPYMGQFLYKYLPDSKYIDFQIDEILFKDNAQFSGKTFINSNNLNDFARTKQPSAVVEEYLSEYLSLMKKGDRLFFVQSYLAYVIRDDIYIEVSNNIDLDAKNLNKTQKAVRFRILYTKMQSDILAVLRKNLKLTHIYNAQSMDLKIYEFEKF